jgi:hypothetical protein
MMGIRSCSVVTTIAAATMTRCSMFRKLTSGCTFL